MMWLLAIVNLAYVIEHCRLRNLTAEAIIRNGRPVMAAFFTADLSGEVWHAGFG
jgi:hypothetical protein